jgi:predicted nucleotidyltransferase/HEPN domain-containing protein
MENNIFTMKTDLDHLSAERRDWIRIVADTIRDYADVEMIILYGSYARGDYVEDPIGRTDNFGGPGDGSSPYYSDLDICVLTEKLKTARKVERSESLRKRLRRDDDRMPLSLIAHTMKHFNRLLELGEYFYVDIAKEGVLLFDSERHHLKWPKNLTEEERKERAEHKLKKWTEKADGFLAHVDFSISLENLPLAAFHLHQASENYLTAAALYLTGYRPHTHRLDELMKQAAIGDRSFIHILPRDSKEDRRLFNLLQAAYVDARYEMNFKISLEDLAAIKTRVESLRTRVHQLQTSS